MNELWSGSSCQAGNVLSGAEAVKQAEPARPERRKRRALVAGTDPANLRLCRDVLESFGFCVESVESGIEAVTSARAKPPDVILVDSQLRDVPGREAVRWLRSNPDLRSAPIIVIGTGAADEAVAALANPGAAIRGPLTPAALRSRIHEFLT